MISAPRVYLGTLPLIATGCVLVAALDLKPANPYSAWESFAIGCSIGTLFGQTTIAAFWTALGPSGLYRRLLFSIIWLTLLVSAVAIGLRLRPESLNVPALGTSLGLLWILIQVPLWLLAFAFGLRLRAGVQSDAAKPQFGLRQLMIFILCVAVILGVSRLPVAGEVLGFRALLGFLILAAPAILISLPLTLAALLPRRAWLAALLVLVLIGLATPAESWLSARIFVAGGPDLMHLVWINLFTSAWILAFIAVGRQNGYRLTWSQKAGSIGRC